MGLDERNNRCVFEQWDVSSSKGAELTAKFLSCGSWCYGRKIGLPIAGASLEVSLSTDGKAIERYR